MAYFHVYLEVMWSAPKVFKVHCFSICISVILISWLTTNAWWHNRVATFRLLLVSSLQTRWRNLLWLMRLGSVMNFLFFAALLGVGHEYLESCADNYPRSIGAFSFQTPWSLLGTLSWISGTNKQHVSYLFISASEQISTSVSPLGPSPAPRHPCVRASWCLCLMSVWCRLDKSVRQWLSLSQIGELETEKKNSGGWTRVVVSL